MSKYKQTKRCQKRFVFHKFQNSKKKLGIWGVGQPAKFHQSCRKETKEELKNRIRTRYRHPPTGESKWDCL